MRLLASTLLISMRLFAQGSQANGNLPRGWPCADARPVDRSYVLTAEASGGQVFLLHPSETALSAPVVIGLQRHDATLFRAMGTLDRNHRDFPVWVDSTVESLMFSVSLQCKEQIAIYGPDLKEFTGGENHEFKAGRFVTIRNPQPGAWQVRVMGRGMFFVTARAKTELDILSVKLVEMGGRPGHEGWFPSKKPMTLGVEQMLKVEVVGPAYSVGFRLVGSDGSNIQELLLKPVDDDDDDWRHFLGPFTPLHPSFRFVAEGRDKKGFVYQRFSAPLFSPVSAPRE